MACGFHAMTNLTFNSICFVTAVCAIVNSLKIPISFLQGTSTEGQAPSSVLVLGGSSATGAATIQLLRKAYPSLPILATSSEKHHARLTDLGATYIVDYNMPGVKQLIPSLTKLVEEDTYRVPLPVRNVGHGLGQLPDVLDEVKTVSGEKLVLTL